MKNSQNTNRLILVALSSILALFLITSCNGSKDITAPLAEAKLVIEDGYYTKAGTTDSGENIYSVVVKYHVEGSDFLISGYNIHWQYGDYGIDINSMVVNPNKTLQISETFKFTREILESPVFTLTGYAMNQKGDGSVSKVTYTIKKK